MYRSIYEAQLQHKRDETMERKLLICEISVPQSGVEVSWPLGFDAVSIDKGALTFRRHYHPSKRR
jgi:hypothetical protein